MSKTDRSYLGGLFEDFARAVHQDFPSPPGSKAPDGLGPAPTLRKWGMDHHPRSRRWSLVKFLRVPDVGLMNHGMGLDVWEGKGCWLRGWAHGKGSMAIEWSVDPTPEEFTSALAMVARSVGFTDAH